MPEKKSTPHWHAGVCRKAHPWIAKLGRELLALPPGADAKMVREVFQDERKVKVFVKFLIQIDCFDFCCGYQAGGLYAKAADHFAHQYWSNRLELEQKARKKKSKK